MKKVQQFIWLAVVEPAVRSQQSAVNGCCSSALGTLVRMCQIDRLDDTHFPIWYDFVAIWIHEGCPDSLDSAAEMVAEVLWSTSITTSLSPEDQGQGQDFAPMF